MAKRKRAAKLAGQSAQGFVNNPLLRASQSAGEAGLGAITGALGLGGGAGSFNAAAYLEQNPGVAQAAAAMSDKDRQYLLAQGYPNTAEGYARYHFDRYGQAEGRAPGGAAAGAGDGGQANTFQNFLNSLGYQQQLQAGMDAITGSRAAAGLLDSGSTAKALNTFGQDLAQQGFGQYLNQLGGLYNAGLQSATNAAQAQQQAKLGQSKIWMQPGALGKAFGSIGGLIGKAV